jgi:RNA polymerase sigma factor (sigma-70 family)
MLKPMNKHLYNTDEEFISGIKRNEDMALNLLYKLHYPVMLNFIINNSGTEQDAKDIYQEAFIFFYEKVRNGTLELNCKIKTYLYSVCRHLWLRRLKEKAKYNGKIEDFQEFLEFDADVQQLSEKEEEFRQMGEALEQLGEPCRTLLEDYYLKNLTMENITVKFGYTNTDNTKNQKYKCLQRLKKIFFSTYNNLKI